MPKGSHIKPTWKAGKTCTIRVPEQKKDYIIALIRALDELDWNASVVDIEIYNQALTTLKEALSFPKNNGSKYHKAILQALALLEP